MRIAKSVSLVSLLLFIMIFVQPLPAQSPQVSAREIFSKHRDRGFSAVAWSPNDQFIAIAGSNEGIPYIELLDAEGKTNISFGPEINLNEIIFLDWNYDSTLIATSYFLYSDGLIHIWDISDPSNPHLMLELDHKPYENKYSQITALEMHPNKNLLMTVGGTALDYQADDNETRTIDIWDIETGELVHEIVNEEEYVLAAYWSPDGKYITVIYLNEAIDLYNATEFKFIKRVKEANEAEYDGIGTPLELSWNQASTKIAGLKCLIVCTVWSIDIDTTSILSFGETPNDTSLYIADLEWNPQYDILASVGSSDDKIMLWNGADGTELLAIETAQRWVADFSWNSTGDKLVAVTLYGDIQIWEILYE